MAIPLFQRVALTKQKYNKKIEERKTTKFIVNEENFLSEYISIIELLFLNNTNKKIVSLYLDFIKKNDKYIKKYGLNTFDTEITIYKIIFTIEEMKRIKDGIKLQSEKNNLIGFLNKLSIVNKEEDILEIYKLTEDETKYIKYFNYPIEFTNQELFYYKIFVLLILHINKVKKEKSLSEIIKTAYIRNKSAVAKLILDNKIFDNDKIIYSEDKMNILTSLILFEELDEQNSSVNFNRLLQTEKSTYEEIKNYILDNKLGIIKGKSPTTKEIILKISSGYIFELYEGEVCLKNLNENSLNILLDIDDNDKFNTLDNMLTKNSVIPYINKIKSFLIKIVYSNMYKEAIKKLFPDYHKYLLDSNLVDIKECINSRIKFYPYQLFGNSSITDKLSCYSYISFLFKINAIIEKYASILRCGAIIYNILHEIKHLNQNIIYFRSNDTNLFDFPKSEGIKREDGGKMLEELLFGRTIKELKIWECFYILNENNYDQSLEDFRKNFENLTDDSVQLSKKMEYMKYYKKDAIFNDFFEIIKDFNEDKFKRIEFYTINTRYQIYDFDMKICFPKKFCKMP